MADKSSGNSTLETSKAERHVWLMKCPPVVARAMQQNNQHPSFPNDPAAGRTVAKVIVAVDPLRPNDDLSSTQFTMELAGTADTNMPSSYSLDMSTDFIPMCVFSESSEGKPSVEGKIYNKFDMKPHDKSIEGYAKLCRERTNKYMTKTRQIQIINDDNGMRMRPMPGMLDFKTSGSITMEKKKNPAKGSETKRTRRDPDEMEKILFKLFEKQPNWTLKNLIQRTDQPEQFLKDMLKVLCVYNNKGANQGSYELKPEYRRSEDNSNPE
ncbi:uncharacterized protein LOC127244963 [Andrographis paniculata]|uniref:uncharacterized protein LOC127244963 n=1 Tax=Andrographis paniculata TaxID=175694 RepID=UPI0021E8EDD9|nr:uncharacterized protein LOC127244963 [Andrographis paniculata]XP_051121539.1 uncharacterized protein LOC127244963 [Andrographis paniculata]XP_051121540.1 uncharacterized protein LOC127244963 [Andrographis paniculata]XP_051121541.1 uncharacterized protein LOC127244963 [Andrographis paniculata]